jgi:hypothetical protein
VASTFTPAGGASIPVDLAASSDGSPRPASVPASAAVFRLAADSGRTLSIPVGALCDVDEFDSGGASSTTVEVTGGKPPRALTVSGATSVAFTNSFPASVSGGGAGRSLSFTGADTWRTGLVALVLLVLGGAAIQMERRRRPLPAGDTDPGSGPD